jgi:YHS domain-containing protein
MKKSTSFHTSYIDPVCLMNVDPTTQDCTFTYRMRTYYFCAEACCNAFAADPEKYLKQDALKHKSWWGRYLERLNKATGGKPPKCCG